MFEHPSTVITKFYQTEVNFNNFSNITDEELDSIIDDVRISTFMQNNNETRFELYLRVLYYLSISKKYMNFEKNMIYLIESMDPELVSYKEFRKNCIISKKEIMEASPEEKPLLINFRNEQIKALQSNIREQIGFYDPKLVKYEQKYYEAFYKKNAKEKLRSK